MKVEVSNGELLDKFSILKIKIEKISEEEKLLNIKNEIQELSVICNQLIVVSEIKELFEDLIRVNTKLWEIEDSIRNKEKLKEFDESFIQLARLVYINNDKRFEIKSRINKLTQSKLIEEKSYERY